MAYTFGDLVTDTRNRLDNSSFSDSVIKQFINDAQRQYFIDGYYRWFEASQAYTLNVGTADITNGSGLPSDFHKLRMVRITTSGKEGVLPIVDYDAFREQYPKAPNANNGYPQMVYEYGDNVYTYPATDTAYAVTMDYYKQPTEMTNDADVPQLPEIFREVLVLGALMRASRRDDDYDQAVEIQQQIDEQLVDLKRRFSGRGIGAVQAGRG